MNDCIFFSPWIEVLRFTVMKWYIPCPPIFLFFSLAQSSLQSEGEKLQIRTHLACLASAPISFDKFTVEYDLHS